MRTVSGRDLLHVDGDTRYFTRQTLGFGLTRHIRISNIRDVELCEQLDLTQTKLRRGYCLRLLLRDGSAVVVGDGLKLGEPTMTRVGEWLAARLGWRLKRLS